MISADTLAIVAAVVAVPILFRLADYVTSGE